MIFSPISQIFAFLPNIQALHNFLNNLNEKTNNGRYEIKNSDIYASITEYNTKNIEEAVLESHCEYIDIQIVLSGAEIGKVSFVNDLEIISNDPSKDLIFYRKPAKFANTFILNPSVFAIFFQYDAHITQIIQGQSPEKVKKAVLKVKKHFFLTIP